MKFIFDRVITTPHHAGRSGIPAVDALDPLTLLTLSALAVVLIIGLRALMDYVTAVRFALLGYGWRQKKKVANAWPRKTPLRMLTLLVVLIIWPANVNAGLMTRADPAPIDEPERLLVNFSFDPEENDVVTPDFNHWNVTLRVQSAPGGTAGFGRWIATATVQHRTNPHLGETLPPPITLTVAVDRGDRPDSDSIAQSVNHPSGATLGLDEDVYTLVFFLSTDPMRSDNNIRLESRHTAVVPEPSTLTLFGVGTLGLVSYGWRRRKRAA